MVEKTYLQPDFLKTEFKLDQFFFDDDVIINQHRENSPFAYFNEGKQLRAHLALGFGQILGQREQSLYTLGRTIEMIHNATLCHDDVIDLSFNRRSAETANKIYGNKKAVLLGDYVLAKALTEVAELNCPIIIKEIALCLKTLVDGEWFQMEVHSPYTLPFKDYETIAVSKTGALFVVCFTCPYALFSEDQVNQDILRKLGNLYGLLFQIKDDLLDFSSGLNKTPFLDFTNNNPNAVLSELCSKEQTDITELMLNTKVLTELPSEYQEQLQNRYQFVKQTHSRYLNEFKVLADQFIKSFDSAEKRGQLDFLFSYLSKKVDVTGLHYEHTTL
jgi:octaprenyl-diphosphate synthase